jgi:hypothetical protein
VSDLGIVHMMLVLQACIIEELLGHRGFHRNFNRKPRRPGNVKQD